MKVIKETCYKGTRILVGNEKREFTQFGVEILNPSHDYISEGANLQHLAIKLLTNNFTTNVDDYVINNDVKKRT
jgi:uncharacterized protein YeeX (DUF496 family)